jgi:hypothetical protein
MDGIPHNALEKRASANAVNLYGNGQAACAHICRQGATATHADRYIDLLDMRSAGDTETFADLVADHASRWEEKFKDRAAKRLCAMRELREHMLML